MLRLDWSKIRAKILSLKKKLRRIFESCGFQLQISSLVATKYTMAPALAPLISLKNSLQDRQALSVAEYDGVQKLNGIFAV